MPGRTAPNHSRTGYEVSEMARLEATSGSGLHAFDSETSATRGRSVTASRSYGFRLDRASVSTSDAKVIRSSFCCPEATRARRLETSIGRKSTGETTGAETMASTRNFEEVLAEDLQDPAEAVEYLNACLEDGGDLFAEI